MKEKTKRVLKAVGVQTLTIGTATLACYASGMGMVALVNHVFKDGLTKPQLKLFGAVTLTGSLGVGYLVAYESFPKFEGMISEVLDIFPTDPDVREVNDAE